MGINYGHGRRSYNKTLYTYSVTLLKVAIVTGGVILEKQSYHLDITDNIPPLWKHNKCLFKIQQYENKKLDSKSNQMNT